MSYTNNAIQSADNFFKINPADGIITKGAKAAGRGISQSVLLVAASIETIFAATITALFSPFSYIFKDKFASLKDYTASSADAVVNAGKSIAGALESNKKAEAIEINNEVAEKSNKEKFVEIATSKYAKSAAAAAAIAGLGYVSYLYGPVAYTKAGEYLASAKETIVPFAKEQMEFVSNKAQEGFAYVKNGLESAYETTKSYIPTKIPYVNS